MVFWQNWTKNGVNVRVFSCYAHSSFEEKGLENWNLQVIQWIELSFVARYFGYQNFAKFKFKKSCLNLPKFYNSKC